ncbi:MAG TPA: FtsQ-type POTRA domain-containing protein [Thermoanaerobaculia bacterium]|nr:FtsQ-type POTRA domain-containing protein [Thermoanaerobaculia bacterium]
MSSLFDSTAPRFLRPNDVASIRRNQRRIDAQRAVQIGRSALLAAIVVAIALWGYRRTQSDVRFAVKTIEVSGAVHAPQEAIHAITAAYTGTNLFKIDIARVQAAFRALPWIVRVDVEKKLPDTLRIRVEERTPSAIVRAGRSFRYADDNGAAFADLSPVVGDADLPLIAATDAADLQRCARLLRDLRQSDPLLYSRISEVRPLPPHAFAIFDRDLGTTVYADAADLSAKWRTLYSIAGAEKFDRGAIAYADLRFNDRIVLRPVHPITTSTAAIVPAPGAEITN